MSMPILHLEALIEFARKTPKQTDGSFRGLAFVDLSCRAYIVERGLAPCTPAYKLKTPNPT